MSNQKLLVTGASGFLGWNLCRIASNVRRVFGTARSRPESIPAGVSPLIVDLTAESERRRMLEESAPDALIHLAAASKPNYCQLHPRQTHRLNVDAAVALAELCASMGIGFVFASSDQVYDGNNAPYTESTPPSPVNVYGEQKAEAERLIRDRNPSAVICRMPLMFGDPSPSAGSFIQPFLASLKSGRPIRLFADEYRTMVGAQSAARGLLWTAGLKGRLLNLGGKERLSRYEFGLRLAAAAGADSSLVEANRQCEVAMPAPRPSDVSMDSSAAFALGYNPLPVDEELARLSCLNE
ncbi:MAG: sugar nucleotide-binding protein [Chitinivibrionales bacterium]|nr:sugar nucleotide-binding protein [Chitinivibrionales bacterium]MBD3355882.1 sugar nucleotide-binding protein [Chitinivibrionales bacterium]